MQGVPFPSSYEAWAIVLFLTLMWALTLKSNRPLTHLLPAIAGSHTDHSGFQFSSSWQFPFFPANLALHLKECYTLDSISFCSQSVFRLPYLSH